LVEQHVHNLDDQPAEHEVGKRRLKDPALLEVIEQASPWSLRALDETVALAGACLLPQ